MMTRAIPRALAAAVLATVLAVGVTAAPAQADPADVWLPNNTWSKQVDVGGCLYKVVWGNFSHVPFTRVQIYNPASCGTPVVAIEYHAAAGVQADTSLTYIGSGTDGCGSFQYIQAQGRDPGFASRGLVWLAGGLHWYANDGLAVQPIHSHC